MVFKTNLVCFKSAALARIQKPLKMIKKPLKNREVEKPPEKIKNREFKFENSNSSEFTKSNDFRAIWGVSRSHMVPENDLKKRNGEP